MELLPWEKAVSYIYFVLYSVLYILDDEHKKKEIKKERESF